MLSEVNLDELFVLNWALETHDKLFILAIGFNNRSRVANATEPHKVGLHLWGLAINGFLRFVKNFIQFIHQHFLRAFLVIGLIKNSRVQLPKI